MLVSMPDWIEALMLQNLNTFNSGDLRIGLFQNNIVPDITDVIGDYTASTASGYTGPQVLNAWTVAGGGFASPYYVIVHPSVTWTATGPTSNTIYGYYVWDNATNKLLFAERRVAGGVAWGGVAGQTYTVVPRYSRASESEV